MTSTESGLRHEVHCYTALGSVTNLAVFISQQRTDLFDLQCRYAKDEGVLTSINSDAHRTADFSYLRYGVAQVRRAWLEKPNVPNTRSLMELKGFLTSCSGRG